MYFQDIASVLHMDGHGIYVWSTYGIGLLIIAYNVLVPLRHSRQVIGQIKRQIINERQGQSGKKAALEP